ncbi:hypothetical protein NL676_014781 [Syzygium grande]|nr:hypothetical protein NL676_014781 [Syzygium grande]
MHSSTFLFSLVHSSFFFSSPLPLRLRTSSSVNRAPPPSECRDVAGDPTAPLQARMTPSRPPHSPNCPNPPSLSSIASLP